MCPRRFHLFDRRHNLVALADPANERLNATAARRGLELRKVRGLGDIAVRENGEFAAARHRIEQNFLALAVKLR